MFSKWLKSKTMRWNGWKSSESISSNGWLRQLWLTKRLFKRETPWQQIAQKAFKLRKIEVFSFLAEDSITSSARWPVHSLHTWRPHPCQKNLAKLKSESPSWWAPRGHDPNLQGFKRTTNKLASSWQLAAQQPGSKAMMLRDSPSLSSEHPPCTPWAWIQCCQVALIAAAKRRKLTLVQPCLARRVQNTVLSSLAELSVPLHVSR